MENVKYKHYRPFEESFGIKVPKVKGGSSAGWTYDEEYLYIAVTNCSKKDNFDKKKARAVIDERLKTIIETKQNSTFSVVIALEELKKYINETNNILKKDTFGEILKPISFKDLTYEFFAHITEKVFYSQQPQK